ncbi:MAG: hypothetical protein QOH35_2953 [Acidobacteriaceae bacterium]|nr:hypothetical protein [Acidobacteriaceae bacterium]
MKFANAIKLYRKSGVRPTASRDRCCEHGAPVLFPVGPLRGAGLSVRAEVSRRTAGLALEFDSSGELEPSGGQCSGGLFEEGGLHVSDVGGVVRSIGDVEGVYRKREREGLV